MLTAFVISVIKYHHSVWWIDFQFQLRPPIIWIMLTCVKSRRDTWMFSWRCHDMEALSPSLALCEVNPPVTGECPWQRANAVELCCLMWCKPEQADEQTLELPVVCDGTTLMWRHFHEVVNEMIVCARWRVYSMIWVRSSITSACRGCRPIKRTRDTDLPHFLLCVWCLNKSSNN